VADSTNIPNGRPCFHLPSQAFAVVQCAIAPDVYELRFQNGNAIGARLREIMPMPDWVIGAGEKMRMEAELDRLREDSRPVAAFAASLVQFTATNPIAELLHAMPAGSRITLDRDAYEAEQEVG
jgi:hypothetical protein